MNKKTRKTILAVLIIVVILVVVLILITNRLGKKAEKNAKYAATKRKQIFLQKYTDARNAIFLSSEWQTISTVILAKLYIWLLTCVWYFQKNVCLWRYC